MNINPAPLALAVLCGGGAYLFWHHRWWPRAISLLCAAAAALAAIAIPVWLYAIAGSASSGLGMVVLVLAAVGGGITFLAHHFGKKKHHPVWTPIVGIVAATAVVVAWAMLPTIGQQGGSLLPKTGQALGQETDTIQAGHAAAAELPNERLLILCIAVLALIALGVIAHRHHKGKPFRGAKATGGLGGGPRALPSGGRRPGRGGRPVPVRRG